MGQYWQLISLDRHESTGFIGKFGELIHTNDSWLENMLTACKLSTLQRLPIKPLPNLETKLLAPVERLPNDIIFKILSKIPLIKDKLRFSVVSYRFAHIGQTYFQMNVNEYKAPWIDTRIICLGDYAFGCYPDGILSKAEIAMLGDESLYYYPDDSMDRPESIYCITSYDIFKFNSWKYDNLVNTLLGYNNTTSPDVDKRILRNKTLHVYVRDDQIPEFGEPVHLGTVLLFQICWSQDPSMAVRGEIDGQEKGPWAGHRFDIVDVNDIENGWADVSDEVIKRIKPILDAEFRGSD